MSPKDFKPMDPQLTAYALGELQGEEAEQMKRMIEKDPEAKKYVEDIQATAQVLRQELRNEPALELSSEQKEKLFAAAQAQGASPTGFFASFKRWHLSLAGSLAVAGIACVTLYQQYQDGTLIEPPVQTLPDNPTAVEPYDPTLEVDVPAPKDSSGEMAPYRFKQEEAPRGANKKDNRAQTKSVFAQHLPTTPAELNVDAITGGAAAPMGGGAALAEGTVAEEPVNETARSARDEVKRLAPMAKAKGGYAGAGIGHGLPMQGAAIVGPNHPGQGVGDVASNTESYNYLKESDFQTVKDNPLSTFSIDVDTASYANIRRFLVNSQKPPVDAVRVEEIINYFKYDYAGPRDNKPFAAHMEMATSPWNPKNKIVRVAIKGKEVPMANRPNANLVFLVDVSGSMDEPNKLPLVQKSLKMLVEQMKPNDKIALVVYAGNSGVVLHSTRVSEHKKINEAIDRLKAGGSTNGASGIELAYNMAKENFVTGGINRVILATDGDFNVGPSSEGELTRIITEKAKTGVFLSVLGFGMGNYKDSHMQKLANNGNGNHSYIDSLREARKTLVQEVNGTLMTIAKDMKIQVEFNPKFVSSYRLIGYEKRLLNAEDFNNDKKDAGEVGAGHTITALYEIRPARAETDSSVDPLKYQAAKGGIDHDFNEVLTLKLRYKKPDGDKSELSQMTLANSDSSFENASPDFKFATSAAAFGMILRNSPHKGSATLDQVREIAEKNSKFRHERDEYRLEFVELVKKAKSLGY